MAADDDAALRALLPGDAAQRLSSLRLVDGVATLVLDASGLDARQRAARETGVTKALMRENDITEVRVAMTADREGGAQAGSPAEPAMPRIIAVGSGKGGVGKSTLSVNLAVALARLGLKVGLVDADIYGPSQARLLGTEDEKPVAHDKRLVPIASRWGVPVLSMAHLTKAGQALAWRGPMAAGALTQLLEAHWEDADVLVVDLPPGTGDVQLTMLQKFRPAGAVIVSTPQDLALIDATRAVELFTKGKVPVLGLVENMSGYICPHCGEESDPFGCGGAEAEADRLGIAFLGRIPLDIAIRKQSDAGVPVAAGQGAQADAFAALAARVRDSLEAVAPASGGAA